MCFFRAVETSVAIICHNDELSSSLGWLDCLLTDSEVFILSAEISQLLLKIYFIPILWTVSSSTLSKKICKQYQLNSALRQRLGKNLTNGRQVLV